MTEHWHIIGDPKTERYELIGEWTEDGQTYGFRHSGLPEAIAKRLCGRLNAAAMRERNRVEHERRTERGGAA